MAVNNNLSPAYGIRTTVKGWIVFTPGDTTPAIVRSDFPATIAYSATGIYRITLTGKLPATVEFGQPSLQDTSLLDRRAQLGTYTQSTGVLDVLGQVVSTGAAGTIASGTIRVPVELYEFASTR